MNDLELFELCKEVYKMTGWQIDNPSFFGLQYSGSPYETDVHITTDPSADFKSPLYTSDYLLEKLPKRVNNEEVNWIDIYHEADQVLEYIENRIAGLQTKKDNLIKGVE